MPRSATRQVCPRTVVLPNRPRRSRHCRFAAIWCIRERRLRTDSVMAHRFDIVLHSVASTLRLSASVLKFTNHMANTGVVRSHGQRALMWGNGTQSFSSLLFIVNRRLAPLVAKMFDLALLRLSLRTVIPVHYQINRHGRHDRICSRNR